MVEILGTGDSDVSDIKFGVTDGGERVVIGLGVDIDDPFGDEEYVFEYDPETLREVIPILDAAPVGGSLTYNGRDFLMDTPCRDKDGKVTLGTTDEPNSYLTVAIDDLRDAVGAYESRPQPSFIVPDLKTDVRVRADADWAYDGRMLHFDRDDNVGEDLTAYGEPSHLDGYEHAVYASTVHVESAN